MNPNDEPEEDGANIDLDAHRKGKCAVIKTSTRQVWGYVVFEKRLNLRVCLSMWLIYWEYGGDWIFQIFLNVIRNAKAYLLQRYIMF